uniref:Klus pretoxin n=1 Tax=Saccharomyces cerevisiae killer virus Mlus TaxID=763863 RepID=D6NTN8_9VIRU|nr:Klus pretoxin [Saccharomyces cerevisiae killer virus Mlus]
MHLKSSGLCLLYLLTTVLSLAAATIVPPTVDNHTVTIIDSNGTVLPVIAARLNLDYFEEQNTSIIKRDATVDDWLTEVVVLPLADAQQVDPNTNLAKRTNVEGALYWLVGSGQCVYEYWDIADGVWQAGWDIYRATSTDNCQVIMGHKNSFYYKYYADDGKCSSTVKQKTIAGALQAAVRQLEGNQLCNNYLFHVDHHGTWHGDVIIGASISAWFTNAKWSDYKGWVDAGCSQLQSPYTCSS